MHKSNVTISEQSDTFSISEESVVLKVWLERVYIPGINLGYLLPNAIPIVSPSMPPVFSCIRWILRYSSERSLISVAPSASAFTRKRLAITKGGWLHEVNTDQVQNVRTMRMYLPLALLTPSLTAPPLPWFSPSLKILNISAFFLEYSIAISVVRSVLASSTIKTWNKYEEWS